MTPKTEREKECKHERYQTLPRECMKCGDVPTPTAPQEKRWLRCGGKCVCCDLAEPFIRIIKFLESKTTPQETKPQEWEKEFQVFWENKGNKRKTSTREYIKHLLASREAEARAAERSRILEIVRGMTGIKCDCEDPKRIANQEHKEWCGCKTKDHNQALTEAIQAISSEEIIKCGHNNPNHPFGANCQNGRCQNIKK